MSQTRTGVPRRAREQAGVFTCAQALAEGWTLRQVRRRLASGAWRRTTCGVLTARPEPLGPEARAWAVRLRWDGAVVTGRTAALLWRIPVRDDGLAHVHTGRGRVGAGAVVHAVAPDPADVATISGGHRVTGRRRTVLDCLASFDPDEALDLYAWATTREVVTREDLLAELARRFGRPGAAALRRLLAVTRSGAVSAAEHRLHGMLRRAGVTGWQAGARIEADGLVAVVDLLFRAHRLVVEVDGERAHSGREAFIRDRSRQNSLVNAGYRVLRFTWWDLAERPDAVVDEIRRALNGRSTSGMGSDPVGGSEPMHSADQREVRR